ncbi:cellulose binding domain-containing protein [Sphaerimonospora sp. CA-214678]|uniref:cellulose binding domain-containing protein n=1 Tax=Sphaerimonospora sp. CA-214678 TaxID=3240029 RepID=UPI003D8A4395
MVGDPAGNYWTSFDSLFASAYAKARAVAPRRPVMIGEVGSSEDGGNKAQWINDMASTLQSGRYPDLKNVVYFDQDKEERWSGTSSSAVQTAFTSWVNQTYMRGTGTDLAKVAAEYKGTSPSPSPSASPSPSPSPSASPSPGGGACSATYATVNSWPGGFQGEVTVRTGASGINGWTARWTLAGGQTISQLWNGTLSISGSEVTVKNVSWNGSLGANASATFGFLANGSPASPTLTCSSP